MKCYTGRASISMDFAGIEQMYVYKWNSLMAQSYSRSYYSTGIWYDRPRVDLCFQDGEKVL